jgi:hypothetical protein
MLEPARCCSVRPFPSTPGALAGATLHHIRVGPDTQSILFKKGDDRGHPDCASLRRVTSAAPKKIPSLADDPVLQALARAPLGPADPPEVQEAILEGRDIGRFTPGAEVSAEIARRRSACAKPGK